MSTSSVGDLATPASAQPNGHAPSGPLVSAPGGSVSVNQASMTATVKAVLGTANEIGGFWKQWGVSTSLFIIGTFAIIVAFIAHALEAKLWGDDSFFGALAFALAILILGFIAFADKQNRSGQSERQAVEIYQATVNASLEGQRIASEANVEGQRIASQERIAAMPRPEPRPNIDGVRG